MLVSLVHGLADARHKRDLSPMRLVKDGQLSWAALLFAAAALYERDEALQRFGHQSSGFATSLAALMLVLNAIVPLCGLIFPTNMLSVRLKTRAVLAHYKLLLCSSAFAAMSAFCYSGVHFGWLY